MTIAASWGDTTDRADGRIGLRRRRGPWRTAGRSGALERSAYSPLFERPHHFEPVWRLIPGVAAAFVVVHPAWIVGPCPSTT